MGKIKKGGTSVRKYITGTVCAPGITPRALGVGTSIITDSTCLRREQIMFLAHANGLAISSDTSDLEILDKISKIYEKCDGYEPCLVERSKLKLQSKLEPKKYKELLHSTFLPRLPGPIEENKWTDKWLSNIEIEESLKQYERIYSDYMFLGWTPIDFFDTCLTGLCSHKSLSHLYSISHNVSLIDGTEQTVNKRCFGIVFNTDTSNGDGEHWISMIIDLRKKPYTLEFYDSVGVSDYVSGKVSRTGLHNVPESVRQLIEVIVFSLHCDLPDKLGIAPFKLVKKFTGSDPESDTSFSHYKVVPATLDEDRVEVFTNVVPHKDKTAGIARKINITGLPEWKKLPEHQKINVKFSQTKHQSGNNECGVYSIYFNSSRAAGITFDELMNNLIPDKLMNKKRMEFLRPYSQIETSM